MSIGRMMSNLLYMSCVDWSVFIRTSLNSRNLQYYVQQTNNIWLNKKNKSKRKLENWYLPTGHWKIYWYGVIQHNFKILCYLYEISMNETLNISCATVVCMLIFMRDNEIEAFLLKSTWMCTHCRNFCCTGTFWRTGNADVFSSYSVVQLAIFRLLPSLNTSNLL